MSTAAIADNVLANVRALLRRHSPFMDMSRHELDVLLGDLERDLCHDLDDLDGQHEQEIALEIQWAREDWEAELAAAKAERKAAKLREAAA